MYDVLFIDDKFEEVKDIYFKLKKEHIRCFYYDAYDQEYLKKNALIFKRTKYICLDFHLENRGIMSSNSNAYSTLCGIIKPIIDINTDCELIINTAFENDFKKEEFKKYLEQDTSIHIEGKTDRENQSEQGTKKFSKLTNVIEELKKKSSQESLRSIVIQEAIQIENLLWKKIIEQRNNNNNVSKELLQDLKCVPSFSDKINVYTKYNDKEDIKKLLDELRKIRNTYAHEEGNQDNRTIIDFLKKIEEIFNILN